MTNAQGPHPRKRRGPTLLFLSWVLHDLEEAATFPATCDDLADRTGFEPLRMNSRQSWTAVGLMGVLVGFACIRGTRTKGRSPLYRAVTAGLEGHVFTHLAASAVTRGYTAGVVSALAVMLPGARAASRELARDDLPLTTRDSARGIVVLIPAAFACHLIVRAVMKRR